VAAFVVGGEKILAVAVVLVDCSSSFVLVAEQTGFGYLRPRRHLHSNFGIGNYDHFQQSRPDCSTTRQTTNRFAEFHRRSVPHFQRHCFLRQLLLLRLDHFLATSKWRQCIHFRRPQEGWEEFAAGYQPRRFSEADHFAVVVAFSCWAYSYYSTTPCWGRLEDRTLPPRAWWSLPSLVVVVVVVGVVVVAVVEVSSIDWDQCHLVRHTRLLAAPSVVVAAVAVVAVVVVAAAALGTVACAPKYRQSYSRRVVLECWWLQWLGKLRRVEPSCRHCGCFPAAIATAVVVPWTWNTIAVDKDLEGWVLDTVVTVAVGLVVVVAAAAAAVAHDDYSDSSCRPTLASSLAPSVERPSRLWRHLGG